MSRHARAIRLLLAAALAVSVVACDSVSTPTPIPTPTPTPGFTPPVPPLTVSGLVLGFKAAGEWVPVANLRLKVRAASRYDGAVDSTPLADTVTDAQGRFTINNNTAFILFFQTEPGSEYRFLCDWSPIVTTQPMRELPVVHKTWSDNRPPPGWYGIEAGWGTVSELIDGSLQPVAGATVTLDHGIPDPPATTSPNGFYMICSVVGADQVRTISAFKTGYDPDTREIFNVSEVHFQLTRR